MTDTLSFRPAEAGDSRFIAEMIDVSSDGVALIEWTQVAEASRGRTPLDVGAEVYASSEGDYSYRNTCVVEVSGRRAGMMLSFPLRARDPAELVSRPPFDGGDVFAPYRYLEAPDTWYICAVSVLSEFRGQGVGTGLMHLARDLARQHGYDRLSLVVFEENAAALRLYQRLGYAIIDRAAIVPHPLIRSSGDALLMVAPVT